MPAIKISATPDNASTGGVAPLGTIAVETSDKSSVFTHHCTNIGIIVPL